jgi:hypothetical protein
MIGGILWSSLARGTVALDPNAVNVSNTVGFIKEDNQRDTISLLISCFATLGLCVYSAVHLNVPRRGERSYRTLLRECGWCIIGLFAPELILYTAWRQLASARQLRYEIDQARDSGLRRSTSIEKVDSDGIPNERHRTDMFQVVSITKEPAQNDIKCTPWTMAHGFYGSMGGFAIDIDENDDQHADLFGGAKRLTLTAKGVTLLWTHS